MQGFGDKKQSKNKNIRNQEKKLDHDQLIQRAFQFQAQGKKLEAAKCYQYLIENGLKDYRIFSNYGTFLKEIGKYQEAEIVLNKAIKLNPRYANAFYNLAVRGISSFKPILNDNNNFFPIFIVFNFVWLYKNISIHYTSFS